MSVDVEVLVVSFLRAEPTVTAIAGDRIYTDLPHERVYPLVLVTRVGGGFIYKNHLEAAEIEVNTYGGPRKVANQLATACMQSMAADLCGTRPEGVVTKLKVTAVTYNPDAESADQSGHARPRFTVGATVTAHP